MNNYRLPENPQKEAFKLPEDYFRHFQENIDVQVDAMERVRQDNEVQMVSLWTKIKPYLYMAAMFVLLFVGIKGSVELLDQDSRPIAQDLLNTPDELPLESEYTAEEYMLGSVSSSDLIYYLFEDVINENN